jgi:hypothetical protein
MNLEPLVIENVRSAQHIITCAMSRRDSPMSCACREKYRQEKSIAKKKIVMPQARMKLVFQPADVAQDG